MPHQVDTNILLRILQTEHPMHEVAEQAVRRLLAAGETLYYLPQNIREFWNVCTRPAERNGLGLPHAQVEAEVQRIESVFSLLEDGSAVYREWRRLVFQHSVTGVQVHDCYIVAAMSVHSVRHLLTFNTTDFARYPGITAVHPSAV